MKLRHIIIIGLFIIINVAVITTLNFGKPQKTEEKNSEEFVQVLEGVKVDNTEEQFNVTGFGTVSSFNTVDISSEVQGKLIAGRKPLKPGVKFKKGETIFTISDRDARYSMRSRKSGFITVLAQMLPDIRIDFPDEFDKWNEYINSIKLNKELPTLPVWKSDKEKIFLASRNVLTEYFTIKSQEELLDKYYATAPYNCVITELYISEHSVVNPGTRIIRIAQVDNFEVVVPVPASALATIGVGTESKIYTTEGEEKGTGTIIRISEVINKSTQSVDVYIRPKAIENKRFIEGEYVRVEINETGLYTGIRLPQNAISDGEVFIFSPLDSSLSRKKVNVLNKNESGVFVSGLENGETAIIQEVLNYSDTLKYGVLVQQKR
ncbi:MAG: HlyD family efflux transporter periplasmic adaptor subunit [Crocinitomicaceae bacterium]